MGEDSNGAIMEAVWRMDRTEQNSYWLCLVIQNAGLWPLIPNPTPDKAEIYFLLTH